MGLKFQQKNESTSLKSKKKNENLISSTVKAQNDYFIIRSSMRQISLERES